MEFSCKLQSYHWQLILYMTWLASTSHMAVLSSLRHYLLTHRKQLWGRFGGMFIVAVMFLVALGLTSNFQSTASPRLARCPVPKDDARLALESRIKIGIFLGYGYTIRVLKLCEGFDKTPRRFSLWLRRLSLRIQNGDGDKRREWDPNRRAKSWVEASRTMLLEPVLIALCRMLHIHVDLLNSFLAEVCGRCFRYTQ